MNEAMNEAMMSAPKITQCPACLFVLQEYGATEWEREARIASNGIKWCRHHRRARRYLLAAVGGLCTVTMLGKLEIFVWSRFRVGRPAEQSEEEWRYGND